jgi:flagellar FliL protein
MATSNKRPFNAGTAKQKSGTFAKVFKTLFAIALIVGASIGATLLYYQQTDFGLANAEMSDDAKPVALPAPIFTPLEPFTVTVRNSQSHRILYVGITLRLADDASRAMVIEYMPEVRDRVLKRLSEQQPDIVQTPEGRQALVQSLTQDLQTAYLPHNKGPDITSVLFTAFVIQ